MEIFKLILLIYLGSVTEVRGNDEINQLSKVFSNGLKHLAEDMQLIPDSLLNIVQSIGKGVSTQLNGNKVLDDLLKSLPHLGSDTVQSIGNGVSTQLNGSKVLDDLLKSLPHLGSDTVQSILTAASTYLNGRTFAQILEEFLKPLSNMDPDTGLSFSEFVDKYNYALETHEVTTEDGYILTLHRIPHRKPDSIKGTEENTIRPVVLLVHGLACSSGIWIWQGPKASLSFQLVDQGYDVWVANARGTSYSDKHVVLTTKQPQFWNFSFHEIGYYDMASSIDYILNVTEVEKITYVGHSQGTTAAAVLLSSRPEFNEKLNLVVMLSPVVYLTQVRSPIVQVAKINNELIKRALELVHIYALERSQLLEILLFILCNDNSPVQGLCITFVELFVGFDVEQIEKSKLTVFFTFTPSGAPYRIADHYIQGMYSGKFRQFDYADPAKNIEKYGSSVPPTYDIAKISAPVALYYSKNDYFVIVDDAERVISELRTEIADQYLIEYEKFNHLDFVTAKDVKELLNDRVVGVIEKYNPLPGN